MGTTIAEVWWRVVVEPSEKNRRELVKILLAEPETVLDEIGRRVAGELLPDTIIAGRSVEVVAAALALRRSEGIYKPLRLILPRQPLPGWAPLLMMSEDLAVRKMVEVYRVDFSPSHKPTARDIYRRAVKIMKGFSARVVDITDASPILAVAAHSAADYLTVAALLSHALVFQKI